MKVMIPGTTQENIVSELLLLDRQNDSCEIFWDGVWDAIQNNQYNYENAYEEIKNILDIFVMLIIVTNTYDIALWGHNNNPLIVVAIHIHYSHVII
jgi:hypothetical protein